MTIDKKIPIRDIPFHESKEVVIGGFVETIRKLKSITFLVIRDSNNSIQVVFSQKEIELPSRESVVLVKGKVVKKEKGEGYEIIGEELKILSNSKAIPIELGETKVSDEKFRMKYRYLDLRRKQMQRNLIFSSKAKFISSAFFHSKGFTEITTPVLSFPSEEGAQTFSTAPNCNVRGSFTLSQSPQIYKQLLMIGGFNSYFQFSTSFRAEKLREERQYEFTQLDIELSFSSQEELLNLVEELMRLICRKLLGVQFALPSFPQITYEEALLKYGTDKPDIRFPPEIFNIFDGLPKNEKIPFDYCYCLLIEFKLVDIGEIFQEANAKFQFIHRTSNKILGGQYDDWMIDYSKSFCVDPKREYYIFYRCTNKVQREKNLLELGKLRLVLSKYDTNKDWERAIPYSFVWVINWPYFQEMIDGSIKTAHHPFTLPIIPEQERNNYRKWRSTAYDLVLNGAEIASGSQRITEHSLQSKIFEILGYSAEEVQKSFGWFLEALQYGVPPHLGIAIGWERLMKELLKESSIREVIAFPKNSHGICSMSS